MPRMIVGAEAPTEPTEGLVQALADELIAPRGGPLPFILERHVRGSKSRHVWVVWDRWADLDEERRMELLLQAYTRAEGAESAANITVALGLLPWEALPFGIVPYLVRPADPSLGRRGDYQQASAEEAARTILGVGAKQLRYPTEDEARRAVDRLEASQPGTEWAIHRDDEEDEG